MLYNFYLGLDLGQAQDYSAISLIEEPLWVPSWWQFGQDRTLKPGWTSPASLEPWQAEELVSYNYHHGRPPSPPLSVRHLERLPLGTRYPIVVERVEALLKSAPLKGKRLAFLVDKTGVGAPVLDGFVQAGLGPIGVFIHGGDKLSLDRDGYRVPKRALVSATQVLFQGGRLKIAESLKEAETLKKELLNFRVKIDGVTAHDSYSAWRENQHDDLVLATSMAAWFRQYHNAHLDQANARVARRQNAG
ncbi:MAG: hypothetical protein M3P49_08735 [Actinomycetota bacterium]|nr:hypothetical protein [Actinomycetota bacterium]